MSRHPIYGALLVLVILTAVFVVGLEAQASDSYEGPMQWTTCHSGVDLEDPMWCTQWVEAADGTLLTEVSSFEHCVEDMPCWDWRVWGNQMAGYPAGGWPSRFGIVRYLGDGLRMAV